VCGTKLSFSYGAGRCPLVLFSTFWPIPGREGKGREKLWPLAIGHS